MKGTVSPELRAIMADPEKRRRFMDGSFNKEGDEPVTIDLGGGEIVVITPFRSRRRVEKRKRSLISVLLGF